MSVAQVKIWDKSIGYLYWDEPNRSAIFEIDETYADAPFNFAPIIHENKQRIIEGKNFNDFFNGLPPCFNDSLPDSFGNTVFKEWMEYNNINPAELNPVERLLYVGQRGVGALEYNVGKELPMLSHTIDLGELSAISDKIIKRKYGQKDHLDNPKALLNMLLIGSSVGGAQAKILVAINEKNELLAGDIIHNEPVDYYITKLAHDKSDIWGMEKNFIEFTYNEIAREAGIEMAESKLITKGDYTHFASKRFDRLQNNKVHMQTLNAITGFYGRNTEFSYEKTFQVLEYLKVPYIQKERLFTQMVFNVAASNRDDHTKNFSFLMDKKGKWSYAPAYDITYPIDPYSTFKIQHKISINNKVKDIERADLLKVAQLVGINRPTQIIDKVKEGVLTFENRIKQYQLNKNTIDIIVREIGTNASLL